MSCSIFPGILAIAKYQSNINFWVFGDRRRVEIARALATSPQVLLLDEPAAGLGETDRNWLAKLIRLLGDRGIKVILIEHDMDLVMKIAERVVVLDSGKIICTGNPEKVQQDAKVLEAYLGITSRDLSRPPFTQTLVWAHLISRKKPSYNACSLHGCCWYYFSSRRKTSIRRINCN